ncbi:MAG: type II and III secretion system protein [Balneolaceae bacterium]|nr:type II and III secretion system protein [Balneolaceae bacterium]MBO6546165.1 type II and III secretion system protein [Balneolaceae bacterium]MBO6648523.1 type II and III secretion system protein [Balneolaceae bacterium]
MKKPIMKKYQLLVYSLLIMLWMGTPFQNSQVYAQDEYPREYTNPDEIIAFDKTTPYVEAMEVINQFLQQYQNKFIIDQSGAGGEIGVNLPAMHWQDALEFILRIKSLGVKDYEDYVEIVPLSQLEAEQSATQSSGGSGNPAEQASSSEFNLDTREVRINATFFEGNKRALQEIGIDWSTLTNDVPANINDIVTGEGIDPDLGVPQGTDFNDQFVSVNSFNASGVSQNVFNALINLGEIGPGIRVQTLFSAFEADNLGEVIATPSIKVVDGEEGRIQVGQDFSIKQRDIAGNVTDQFFSTGTILTVTPQVIADNDTTFIHLDLAVERSTAQPDAVSTIINKQEATTQAFLLDGEATSIAGLYRTEENKVRRGIPILKDLPPWFFGLRYLFGYNSDDYIESELIIIVQAKLEESLGDRLTRRTFDSQRQVLENTQDNFRTSLDQVFNNEFASPPVEEIEEDQQPETTPVDTTSTTENETPDESKDEVLTEDMGMEEEAEDQPEELTDEQRRLAEELSLPVDNPELMVVVPKAFSLDEYLTQKENGQEIEEVESSDLKYFIIGGSFIVQSNADRFHQGLIDEGFDTRVLFHPESRFNFVAYQGFSKFDDAVEYLRSVRADLNSEAWLFTKPE